MKMKNRSLKHTLVTVSALLDSLAQDGTRATYGYVAEHVGMHPHSTALWKILGEIVELDHKAGKHFRSALVVNANSHEPGALFISKVKSLGVNVTDELDFYAAQYKGLGIDVFKPVLAPLY